MIARCVVPVLLLVACGSEPPRVELPPVKDALPDTTLGHVEPTQNLDIVSQEISFKAGSETVPATIVRPKTGRWPGMVLIAGSGPTDRDWNSPLIPTKNGSGKLLAEALAKHGMVVIRYDKVGTGKAAKPDFTALTIDTYSDEARGALTYLRNRPEVDGDHLFVAGHSEGGIHAIRVALAEASHIAGLVLLSSPGRSMQTVILGQLEPQVTAAMPGAAGQLQMKQIKTAFDDFAEAKPVDPLAVSAVPQLQQLVGQIVAPETAMLSRALFSFDPAVEIAKISLPTFVLNGLKDMQVDPQLDAGKLEAVRRNANRDVTLFLAPDADHVLKHEIRGTAELRANMTDVQNGYNAPTRKLDDTVLSALVNWLSLHTQPKH